MAADESLMTIRAALRSVFTAQSWDDDLRAIAARIALAALVGDTSTVVDEWAKVDRRTDLRLAKYLLAQRSVQLMVAATAIAHRLRVGDSEPLGRSGLPLALLQEVALLIADEPQTVDNLQRLLRKNKVNYAANAASILHASGVVWEPRRKAYLRDAFLRGVRWEGLNLSRVVLRRAQLAAAQLDNCDFLRGDFCECNLCGASLKRAVLESANLTSADLSGADLASSRACGASFQHAKLAEASFSGSDLRRADLSWTKLIGTQMYGADLSEAMLHGAVIDDTDFTCAKFCGTKLRWLELRKAASLANANFSRAVLESCDLEFVVLVDAHFESAAIVKSWLTGTVMPNANFRGAAFLGVGMADIDWEGADLRDADLRGCQFQMGSSRCGLVDSPYPSHGTRTGFYTDPYEDRYHKPPEEIRKANLRFADLRGAKIRNVDFYLVDLRGARYDAQQAELLRRCQAIL
jgi:uncharacterized protein YjbI with pentapeptide repeats